mmetsp:Transcript_28787/g.79030  ORF Transcript_28787/g.79030 Transcript_28787/m.79030 type:complete len:401 (-) Transcript_28787:222-1424(-)
MNEGCRPEPPGSGRAAMDSPSGNEHGEGVAAARSWPSVTVGCQVAILALVWWGAAVVVTLWIKAVLSSVNGQPAVFPHSFLFTGILNLCVAIWSLLLAQGYRLVGSTGGSDTCLPGLRPREVAFLLFVGTFQGLELGLTNKALSLVSVSVNRMVMACCVVFQLLTAVCWGLESIGMVKWAAAALLVVGGVLENLPCGRPSGQALAALCGPHPAGNGKDEAENTILGWVCIVASVLTSANRWAFTQHIFQRTPPTSALRRLSKVEILPLITPGTTIVCFLLAVAFEHNAFGEFPHAAGHLALPSFVISLAVMTLTVCELRIVHVTAATVMVILAVVHNIPIILGGVIINHDHVYRNQWLGFSLCSLGAGLYFIARAQDQPKHPQQERLVETGSDIGEQSPA